MSAAASPRPRVLVVGMGGTIAMQHGIQGLAPALSAAEIVAASLASDGIDLEAVDLCNVSSVDLNLSDIARLADLLRAGAARGVIGGLVLHGTDTLEESAFALDLLLGPDGPPVVMTGAMRSPALLSADGPANVAAALQVLLAMPGRSRGVLVVLNDEAHHAWTVQKTSTGSVAAFASPGFGPVGRVTEGRADLPFEFRRPTIHLQVASGASIPKVALLKIALGLEPDLVPLLGPAGYRGLVVEALGAGHVPSAWMPVLRQAVAEMPVVFASRPPAGRTFETTYGFPGSERDLVASGLVPAGHLTSSKARILLALALAADPSRYILADLFRAAG